jgi:hypothetical protein
LLQWYTGFTGLATDTVAEPLVLLPQAVGTEDVVIATAVDAPTDMLEVAEQPLLFTVTV